MEKEDTVAFATVVHPAAETFEYEGKTLNARRGTKPQACGEGAESEFDAEYAYT